MMTCLEVKYHIMFAAISQMVQDKQKTKKNKICICGCGDSAHECDKILFVSLGERNPGINSTTLIKFNLVQNKKEKTLLVTNKLFFLSL